MLLLGAVLHVNKYHVTFSLPFNLRGIVAISDVSDHVTKLVKSETQGLLGEDNDLEVSVTRVLGEYGIFVCVSLYRRQILKCLRWSDCFQ